MTLLEATELAQRARSRIRLRYFLIKFVADHATSAQAHAGRRDTQDPLITIDRRALTEIRDELFAAVRADRKRLRRLLGAEIRA